jgi:hypothetical protein
VDNEHHADEATGLPCLIKRGPVGALCGYVAVPEGHPWYRVHYFDVTPHPNVHGELTYASHCQEGDDPAQTICHIPEPGEPDNVWWLGFDCAHAGDLTPLPGCYRGSGDAYRTLAYVEAECARLAQQIVRAQS